MSFISRSAGTWKAGKSLVQKMREKKIRADRVRRLVQMRWRERKEVTYAETYRPWYKEFGFFVYHEEVTEEELKPRVSCFQFVQFSRSVVSNSLRPHEPQHARPPCPSPTPGVHPNPCPLRRWCHPTMSSSVVPCSSCPQSFPASGSFQMSQLSASGGVLEFQLQHQYFLWQNMIVALIIQY